MNEFFRLMFVTNKPLNQKSKLYAEFVKTAVQAGVTSLQLRVKDLQYNEAVLLGLELKKLAAEFKIPLIVNDKLDLALELDADGLHVGQSDGDIFEIRKKLGFKKILGLSVESVEQLHTANDLPIDYIGCGAIFPTNNKPDVKAIWGIHGLKKVCVHSKHKVIAIGGVNLDNAKHVLEAGASGIAAIELFHTHDDVALTVRKLRELYI